MGHEHGRRKGGRGRGATCTVLQRYGPRGLDQEAGMSLNESV